MSISNLIPKPLTSTLSNNSYNLIEVLMAFELQALPKPLTGFMHTINRNAQHSGSFAGIQLAQLVAYPSPYLG